METKKLNVKLGEKDAERVAHCMEAIAGDISADDIIEIVLRSEPEKVNPDATMTSKELANVGRRQHAAEFKCITRFLCTDATDDQKKEFLLDSFTTQNGGKEYPMYRMTEKGCSIYFDLFKDKMIYRSVQEAVKNMREEFLKKFHPEEIQETLDGAGESEFLFENKPKETYKEYSEIFNMFLDSTAYNGREIAELTDEYSAFIRAMDEIRLSAQENNKMLFAMHDVAMKAEKQGFIYGLKLADTLLSNRVQKAAFA